MDAFVTMTSVGRSIIAKYVNALRCPPVTLCWTPTNPGQPVLILRIYIIYYDRFWNDESQQCEVHGAVTHDHLCAHALV